MYLPINNVRVQSPRKKLTADGDIACFFFCLILCLLLFVLLSNVSFDQGKAMCLSLESLFAVWVSDVLFYITSEVHRGVTTCMLDPVKL